MLENFHGVVIFSKSGDALHNSWIGTYPIFYNVNEQCFCPDCALESVKEQKPTEDLVGHCNFENPHLYCESCGKNIEAAYICDDDEESSEEPSEGPSEKPSEKPSEPATGEEVIARYLRERQFIRKYGRSLYLPYTRFFLKETSTHWTGNYCLSCVISDESQEEYVMKNDDATCDTVNCDSCGEEIPSKTQRPLI